ncbi:MAG: hypothetical protein IAE78_13910 [Myxococcus sp.]|nr:hypothetical protein [Myxococcus sp.]
MTEPDRESPLIKVGDRFLPERPGDPQELRRLRASILQGLFGFVFAVSFGCLYGFLGSPWSGVAIAAIAVGVAVAPFALRRGVTPFVVGNATIGITYLATFVVASRSGGFSSPAIVWCFLLPLTTYVACGSRSALVWAGLASLQLALFFGAQLAGVQFANDFSPGLLALLTISSNAGVLFATVMVLFVVDGARQASERAIRQAQQALERERLLGDMHDGVGSQLLGLIAQARAGKLGGEQLVSGLEGCLDDVRLIVNSLDPVDRPLETALGELRAREAPRCEAAGVELSWSCELGRLPSWPPGSTLQVLRVAQELLTNALRHARARHVSLRASLTDAPQPWLVLEIRDDGVGFDAARPPKLGRGLKSLRGRARKLGGSLEFSAADPGTRAVLRCPTALEPSPPA